MHCNRYQVDTVTWWYQIQKTDTNSPWLFHNPWTLCPICTTARSCPRYSKKDGILYRTSQYTRAKDTEICNWHTPFLLTFSPLIFHQDGQKLMSCLFSRVTFLYLGEGVPPPALQLVLSVSGRCHVFRSTLREHASHSFPSFESIW